MKLTRDRQKESGGVIRERHARGAAQSSAAHRAAQELLSHGNREGRSHLKPATQPFFDAKWNKNKDCKPL